MRILFIMTLAFVFVSCAAQKDEGSKNNKTSNNQNISQSGSISGRIGN